MAFTKLYITQSSAPFTPTNFRGSWNDTGGSLTRALDDVKNNGGAIASIARAETSASNTHSVLLYRGVSGPIAAQTFGGTVDVVIGVSESNAAADFAYHLHIYLTAGDTDTVRGTLVSDYIETTANEWPTTAAGQALATAQSLSAVAATAGDRIVVEIGYRALNTSTTSRTGTLYAGTQAAADLSIADDLTAGGTSVTVAPGFIQFSASVSTPDLNARVTQLAAEIAGGGSNAANVTQLAAEIAGSATQIARISQIAVEYISPSTGELNANVFVST